MTFYINNSKTTNYPSFAEVKVTGYFSSNNAQRMILNSSNMRYYVPSNSNKHVTVNYDCNVGIEIFRKREKSLTDEHLDLILQWILKDQQKIQAAPSYKQR